MGDDGYSAEHGRNTNVVQLLVPYCWATFSDDKLAGDMAVVTPPTYAAAFASNGIPALRCQQEDFRYSGASR
jgi:hypothetical protein